MFKNRDRQPTDCKAEISDQRHIFFLKQLKVVFFLVYKCTFNFILSKNPDLIIFYLDFLLITFFS